MKYSILLLIVILLSSCKKEDLSGCIGEKKEPACFENYSPVCGCDGKTYSNTCYAEAAGVKSWIEGECDK